MKIGLHIPNFPYPGGSEHLADDLASIAVAAEEGGFAKLSVMDHVWQIGVIGPPEREMLEAYTTLGFIAARTQRVRLLALATAASYAMPASWRIRNGRRGRVRYGWHSQPLRGGCARIRISELAPAEAPCGGDPARPCRDRGCV